jgi:hypothetical protein
MGSTGGGEKVAETSGRRAFMDQKKRVSGECQGSSLFGCPNFQPRCADALRFAAP